MNDVTKDLLEAQTTVDAETVDRAWARFCGAFGDGPDAPYPGMIAAFETHYGQSFRDKEWRTEAACWAAAWSKATARAEASLAEPQPDADGPWKTAVIEQLIIAHILTAEHESDPLKALQDLLAYHTEIAVDPRVSGAAAKLVEQAKADVESAATERANERANASWALMCKKMVAAEREACLAEVEQGIWFDKSKDEILASIADAIRARGQK